MNLYEILGVPKTATKAEIRKAYRAKAKVMHPDHGGDPVAFNSLTRAYKALSNDKARARYDATGDEGEAHSTIDTLTVDAVDAIAHLLEAMLSTDGFDFLTNNIQKELAEAIGESIKLAKRSITTALKKRERVERAFAKFKHNKPDSEDFIGSILRHKLLDFDRQIEDMNGSIKKFERAAEIVAEYSYTPDAPASGMTADEISRIFNEAMAKAKRMPDNG